MFETIAALHPRDNDYPERTRILDLLTRILDGTFYDALPYQFHEERALSGEYIPLRQRRPSVRYALCRIVVEDSVALLFSEGHFPTIDSSNVAVRDALADIVDDSRLNEVMIEAALRGSVGSVAILMRVLRGRVFFSILESLYLIPEWDPEEPDRLKRVRQSYKVPGSLLAAQSYEIAEPGVDWWFMREWDEETETWFLPWPVSATDHVPQIDTTRSTRHGLGFVPIVWIKNLLGRSVTGDPADGASTFSTAIPTAIEIDYQLSQAGRGLKYSSDPTLIIKEPVSSDSEIVKGAGNALVLSEKGDAKLLEIGGTASAAVIEYVRTLREFALESVHGSRASAERLSAATSGRALELMNQGLIWLADNLRISYGQGALLGLARMVLKASQRYGLKAEGREIGRLDPTARLSLKWPRWYPSSADDRQKDAVTISTLAKAGQISRETAVKSIADTYDIADIGAELKRISEDEKEEVPK